MSNNIIETFFKPKSVAVIGASASEKKVGYAILRNLIKNNYPGKIFPVNPKRKEIMGLTTYNSLSALPEAPELAILAIPPASCIEAVRELGKMGCKAFLVISAGFKETGEKGKALEENLVRTARSLGARIVGPNCLGIMDTHTPLNATFATVMPPKGNVAVVSQSGALLSAFFDWSIDEGVGFSKVISLGNQADLDEADFIEFLGKDTETDVILAYIEGVKDGLKLVKKLQTANVKKPVIILKVGRTEAGARASSSHTGSITGSDDAYNAAFTKAGVIRAQDMRDLFVAAKIFSHYKPIKIEHIAILTNAGGPGIMAADAVENSSLKVAQLSEKTREALKRVLPPMASVKNPVDVIGDADAARYKNALEILLEAEEVDSVLVLLTPQLMTEIAETARIIAKSKKHKPIVSAFMGRKRVREGVEVLKSHHVPNYEFPEEAVNALNLMNLYLEKRKGFPIEVEFDSAQLQQTEEIVNEIKKNYLYIDEYPAKKILKNVGISVPKGKLVQTFEEGLNFAREIGYPLVLKISSPHILHKSDVKGVFTGIKTEEELKKAFSHMERVKKNINTEIRGFLLEKMIEEGIDMIVGFKKDPTFGAVLLVGLGGIYVEVLKDVAYGICPVSELEALDMIRRLKSFPILEGIRGGIKANIDALIDVIKRFSLIASLREIPEGEINPLRVTDKEAIALDARFIFR